MLFEGVTFFCAPSISPEQQANLAVLLEANGATLGPVNDATHIISNSVDFEGSQDVSEGAVLVTDLWVDRSLILGKLQSPQYFSPDPAMLFSGTVATATDISYTDIEVLSAGITALGGQWRPGLTRDVTHLFAAAEGSDKYETAVHFQKDTRVKILVPHWFDDSVRLGIRGLTTANYEWPDPVILKSGKALASAEEAMHPQNKVPAEKKTLYKAATMPAELENKLGRAKQSNVWDGRRIMLSSDLELSEGRRLAVEAGIVRAGGDIVVYDDGDEVPNFDVLVGRYRWGDFYVAGMNGHKLIGTLTWLFHVESTGTISQPTSQLLHYPIPKTPIEGFAAHEITVTNYTGESREYLKKLISLMGATFTPSMTGKNTVLIAAFVNGNKTAKAKNWSIPVVNHTWLEDCFVQWKNLTVGLEKYIAFPPGLDFSEHLGERGVGRAVVLETLQELVAEMEKVAAGDEPGSARHGVAEAEIGSTLSQRDAEEVEEVVEDGPEIAPMEIDRDKPAPDEDDGRDAMDVDQEPDSSPSPQGPRRTRRAAAAAASPQNTPAHAAPSPKKRPAHAAVSDEEASPTRPRRAAAAAATSPVSRRKGMRPKAASSSKRILPAKPEVTDEEEEEEEVRPQAKKARGASSSKHASIIQLPSDTSDSEEDVLPKAKVRRQPAGKASKSRAHVADSSGTDESEEPVSPKAKKAGPSSRVGRQPAAAHTPLKASKDSAKPKSVAAVTPRRTLSVVMPPLGTGAALVSPQAVRTPKKAGSSKKSAVAVPADEELATASSSRKLTRVRDPVVADSSVDNERDMETSFSVRKTARRSAANKATQKLHDVIMPDLVNFEKERRRGSIREAGAAEKDSEREKGKAPEKETKAAGKRRLSTRGEDVVSEDEDRDRKKRRVSGGKGKAKGKSAADNAVESEDEDQAKPVRRKKTIVHDETDGDQASTSDLDQPPRLMTTQLQLSDDVMKALTKLGAKMTVKTSECTHLIVKNLGRTEKFLCAMAVAPFIVTDKWATASAAAKQLLPPDRFRLADPENERKFDFKLADALRRAKANQGRLFAGMVFYVTNKVSVDKKLLKNVVAAHGGQIRMQNPTTRIFAGKEKHYVVSCPEDAPTWRPLAHAGHPIYSQELLLNAALTQTIRWDDPACRVS